MTLSGAERVVYHFKGSWNLGLPRLLSAIPKRDLRERKALRDGIWGVRRTTELSFEWVTLSGKERVLHNFKGFPNDGYMPSNMPTSASLTYLNGKLYGTTVEGGRTRQCGYYGCGTVFEVGPVSGAERVVYIFQSRTSGANPAGGLLAVRGALYGTAYRGGRYKTVGPFLK